MKRLLLLTLLLSALAFGDDANLSYYGLVGWGIGAVVPAGACNPPSFFLQIPSNNLYTCKNNQLVLSSSSATPGGTNTAVQFNSSSAFGGDATNFGYNSSTHLLTATGGFTTGAVASVLTGATDGYFLMTNNAATGFTGLQFGGTTSSFPMWKRSTTTLAARLADDSGDANVTVNNLTINGTCTGCSGGGGTVGKGVSAYETGAYTTTSGANTPLPFDTNDFDDYSGAIHSTSTNTTRFTANATGRWLASCAMSTSTGSGNYFVMNIRITLAGGGSTIYQGGLSFSSVNSSNNVNVSRVFQMNSGDYMECLYFTSSAIGLSVGLGNNWGQLIRQF